MADQITYRIGAMFSAKGNLAAKSAGMVTSVKSLSLRLADAGQSASQFGDKMLSSSTQAAAGWGKVGSAIAGAGLAASAGLLAKAGLEGNAGQERMQNTVAGTLQLFNHSAGAADQLGTNLKVAGAAMAKISDIADAAPGEMKDVQQLFTNMLPGARSVTGEMQRILDLTKSAAVFTPTFGGDFGLVGSQLSRIMTGGAGAEMETWKTLQVPILKAGQAMDLYGQKGKKVFSETQAEGEKLTQAFNKLGKEDRLRLVEAAMKGGADDLAKMYAGSWEGASSSAISSGRKVAMAFTAPIFGEVKKALIGAGEQPNSLLGKNRIARLQGQAAQIGVLMARPVSRILAGLERGVRYFQDNFNSVVNRMYQAMQVGAALIKAAFAYGLAKMAAGAAITAASGAVRAGKGLVGGARSVGVSVRDRHKKIRDSSTVDGISMFFSRIAKGNPMMLVAGQGLMSMGIGLVSVVPMLLLAAAALAVFSIPFIAIAGIAAYVASKWSELSASIVKGFNDGSISIRPLIIAAMVLWERLKRLGGAFIGGQTGATMMQKAINMATSVVNGISEAIAIMAGIAAGMLKIVGKLANAYDAVFGESDAEKQIARTKELMGQGAGFDEAQRRAAAEQANGFNVRGPGFGDDAIKVAAKLEEAAKAWRGVDIKNLNVGEIDDLTAKATEALKKIFGPADPVDPKNKPKGVSIGTAIIQVDLRNTDPDRMMVGLIEPIKKAMRQPDSSSFDMGGF